MKPERLQEQLAANPGWQAKTPTQQILRQYQFPTFDRAVQCANLVARKLREAADHHVVGVTIRGTTFELELSSTAADGGVTDAQFDLAKLIDQGVMELEAEAPA